MPPLFSSTEFWTSLLVALVGGGGVGAIIGAISSRRKDTADIAAKACDILTDSVIKPLREQVESQEEQIQHLEVQQRKYFALTAYTRSLFHWLQQFCEIVEPDFLKRHPKPHLPDELRADVAPETAPAGRAACRRGARDRGGRMTFVIAWIGLAALVLLFNRGAHM